MPDRGDAKRGIGNGLVAGERFTSHPSQSARWMGHPDVSGGLEKEPAPGISIRHLKTVTSDDGSEGDSQAGLDSSRGRLTCGQGVRECRSPPWSRVIESDGLDFTAEECVLLVQAIECGVQVRDNCVCLVGDDDEFDIDLFVLHLNPPSPSILCLVESSLPLCHDDVSRTPESR